MFIYTISARRQGAHTAAFGFIVAAASSMLLHLLLNSTLSTFLVYPGAAAFVLLILFGVALFSYGLMRIIRGGGWFISVSDKEIIWEAPSATESCFRFPLNEVEHIEKQLEVKLDDKGKKRMKFRYYLVSKARQRFELSSQSGIDVPAFVKEAIAKGIDLKETVTERQQGSALNA